MLGIIFYDIRDRSRPAHAVGTAIDITIPFDGDAQMFRVRPNTFNSAPPRAIINNQSLLITVQGTRLDPNQVRQSIDRTLQSIKQHLDW